MHGVIVVIYVAVVITPKATLRSPKNVRHPTGRYQQTLGRLAFDKGKASSRSHRSFGAENKDRISTQTTSCMHNLIDISDDEVSRRSRITDALLLVIG